MGIENNGFRPSQKSFGAHFYSGMEAKTGPHSPFITPPDQRAKHMKNRNFASDMGNKVETAALGVLGGKLLTPIEDENLRTAFNNIIATLSPTTLLALNKVELVKRFDLTESATPNVYNRRRQVNDYKQEPTHPDLATIIGKVDKIFHTDLSGAFQSIPEILNPDTLEYQIDPEKIRYLILTSLALARLALEPNPINFGHIIPDVRLSSQNQLLVQFDGIFKNKLQNVLKISSLNDLSNLNPWGILEIKLPINLITKFGLKIMNPARIDIAHLKNQVAKVLLASDFSISLPKYCVIAYLGSIGPHAIFPINIGYEFVWNWANDLERLPRNPNLTPSEMENVLKLWVFLLEQQDKLKGLEDHKIIDFTEFNNQLPLDIV